jgi:hypothetical protein
MGEGAVMVNQISGKEIYLLALLALSLEGRSIATKDLLVGSSQPAAGRLLPCANPAEVQSGLRNDFCVL